MPLQDTIHQHHGPISLPCHEQQHGKVLTGGICISDESWMIDVVSVVFFREHVP